MTTFISESGVSASNPTAGDLIRTAAIKLGALASGESLGAGEAIDGLNVLNSMLDSWATDGFHVYQIVQNGYSWASGNQSRTIGSGGNFDTTRPTKIDSAFFRDSNNYDYPVAITNDRRTYDAIADKADQSSYPQALFYDPAYPLGVLYAYPVPSQTLTLYLKSWQILQSFSALTTALDLPPGYQWLIEHSLAVQLQSVFALPVPAQVEAEANKALRRMQRLNHRTTFSSTDAACALGHAPTSRNIYQGP